MRLTHEMHREIFLIDQRTRNLMAEFHNMSEDSVTMYNEYLGQATRLKHHHGEELEPYKVKLENFYSDTDVKEQTFHDCMELTSCHCARHPFSRSRKHLKC